MCPSITYHNVEVHQTLQVQLSENCLNTPFTWLDWWFHD